MIVTRTPLRISFFSGGSDLPAYYNEDIGIAFSATIDKYIHVIYRETPVEGIRLSYEHEAEKAARVDEVQHAITRETLKWIDELGSDFDSGRQSGCVISSVSDIACRGSGLGSSSAFAVGLIRAVHSSDLSKRKLAEAACDIEMTRCGFPVGKQDQYAAAYGGFNTFTFSRGHVGIDRMDLESRTVLDFANTLILAFSGIERDANVILASQSKGLLTPKNREVAKAGAKKALLGASLVRQRKFNDFGELLDEAWVEKRKSVEGMTSSRIDEIYDSARNAGALGGKLLGAGGGGFFLFSAPRTSRASVIEALSREKCVVYPFSFVDEGSRVLLTKS